MGVYYRPPIVDRRFVMDSVIGRSVLWLDRLRGISRRPRDQYRDRTMEVPGGCAQIRQFARDPCVGLAMPRCRRAGDAGLYQRFGLA